MTPAPRSAPPPDATPRARLVAGMAAAIRERGAFHDTTVADVVRHAHTSRRTFYEHFTDRESCFLALFDDLAGRHLAAIAGAAAGPDAWTERLDRAFATYLEAMAAERVVAHACLLEIWSVGPAGVARSRRWNERWARQIMALLDEARATDPQLRPIPFEVATVITGGLRDVLVATLEEGGDLTALHAMGVDLIRRLVTA